MPRKNNQLNTEAYFSSLHSVFAALREYAESDAAMSSFIPVLRELEHQSGSVAAGELEVPTLEAEAPVQIPSRDHARRVIEIVSRLPSLPEKFEQDKKIVVARLLENLVVAITGTIFVAFPDLIPHE